MGGAQQLVYSVQQCGSQNGGCTAACLLCTAVWIPKWGVHSSLFTLYSNVDPKMGGAQQLELVTWMGTKSKSSCYVYSSLIVKPLVSLAAKPCNCCCFVVQVFSSPMVTFPVMTEPEDQQVSASYPQAQVLASELSVTQSSPGNPVKSRGKVGTYLPTHTNIHWCKRMFLCQETPGVAKRFLYPPPPKKKWWWWWWWGGGGGGGKFTGPRPSVRISIYTHSTLIHECISRLVRASLAN